MWDDTLEAAISKQRPQYLYSVPLLWHSSFNFS